MSTTKTKRWSIIFLVVVFGIMGSTTYAGWWANRRAAQRSIRESGRVGRVFPQMAANRMQRRASRREYRATNRSVRVQGYPQATVRGCGGYSQVRVQSCGGSYQQAQQSNYGCSGVQTVNTANYAPSSAMPVQAVSEPLINSSQPVTTPPVEVVIEQPIQAVQQQSNNGPVFTNINPNDAL